MTETAYFATGCFWGAERRFWQLAGVTETAVGYMGGRGEQWLIVRNARGEALVSLLRDELQAQADDILGAMIQEVEAKSLDDSALTAFQVSLDQAQTAISDRRSVLLGLPMRPRPAVAAV